MANQNGEQSWPLGIVRLIFYVALGIAVGYAIARFWPANFDLHRPQ